MLFALKQNFNEGSMLKRMIEIWLFQSFTNNIKDSSKKLNKKVEHL